MPPRTVSPDPVRSGTEEGGLGWKRKRCLPYARAAGNTGTVPRKPAVRSITREHMWGRDSFCYSSRKVTTEVIKAYIAQQSHDSDEVLRIEGKASPSGDPS